MNKRIFNSVIALLLLAATAAVATAPASYARTRVPASSPLTTAAATAQDPLTMLPASDAVVTADVRRILSEALPRALASDQAKLTKVNADIDRFKTRTGVDLRSVEKMALGVRIRDMTAEAAARKSTETGQQTVLVAGQPTRMEPVAIARGTFRADLIVAAGRLAAKDKYRTEKYADKNIYIFTLDEQTKLFGLFNMRLTDVAISVLDTNTLALGQLARVREAIDAAAGRGRVREELVQLATRTPNALIGFGANVPPAALRELGVLGIDSDEISKNIASIRQVYGSIGMTTGGFDMQAIARTENPQAAKSLNDTIAAAKEFAAPLVSQFLRNEAKAKMLRNTLDSLKVTTAGNELQIRLEVAQSDISTLVSGI
jgi:hypothetical protein